MKKLIKIAEYILLLMFLVLLIFLKQKLTIILIIPVIVILYFVSQKIKIKNFPLFIKPKQGKLFTGFICNSEADIAGRFSPEESIPVYCSEVRNIITEWRCFVRYGEILDIRRYKGELGRIYSFQKVKEMISSYSDAPAAYSLDLGITSEGDTLIVEVNDGYALGSYGLDPLLYAKLLSARWAELTGTEDECAFDIR